MPISIGFNYSRNDRVWTNLVTNKGDVVLKRTQTQIYSGGVPNYRFINRRYTCNQNTQKVSQLCATAAAQIEMAFKVQSTG